ncbi:MAG: cell division protein FtsH [Ruminococcaceae bacterium]|nr:cell division protein FtsH [Oscillospiraceae bacterium]
MNEVKTPKKPMMFYYGIFLAVIILFNAIVMPFLNNMRVKEVDYGTFIRMTTELNINEVEIQDNQIVFSDKNGNFYKT